MKEYPSIDKKEIRETIMEILKFFLSILYFTIRSIKKNLLIFIALLLVFVGLGYYLNKDSKTYYSSEMVCNYNYLHKKVYGEMIYRVNYLAQTSSYNTLAKELNIPVSSAQKVIRLEAKNIAGSPLHEDITEDRLPIYITAAVSEKDVFSTLQTGILSYFNNGIPYHQKREELERERLNNNVNFLGSTIDQIDELIKVYTNNLSQLKTATDSVSLVQDMNALIRQKEELNTKMLSDQKMMSLQVAVELLYGFAPTTYPNVTTGVSIYKILLFSFLLAWGAVIVINLLRPKQASKA